MNVAALATIAVSCFLASPAWEECTVAATHPPQVFGAQLSPAFTGSSLDVVLTAEAAYVWDVASGKVLYEKNAHVRRPAASLVKLATVLVARNRLALTNSIVIPAEAATAGRRGANLALPVGQHVAVSELLAASLIPSANDAAVALAVAVSGSEAAFVEETNRLLPTYGVLNTHLGNATGLSGSAQYSTAADVRMLLTAVYQDPALKRYLAQQKGLLTTQEGVRRAYTSTNELLGTYVDVLAAKTGYTTEAGQNLALITQTEAGKVIGAVVLGSENRFQDMKILVEWTHRNYTWP